ERLELRALEETLARVVLRKVPDRRHRGDPTPLQRQPEGLTENLGLAVDRAGRPVGLLPLFDVGVDGFFHEVDDQPVTEVRTDRLEVRVELGRLLAPESVVSCEPVKNLADVQPTIHGSEELLEALAIGGDLVEEVSVDTLRQSEVLGARRFPVLLAAHAVRRVPDVRALVPDEAALA